MKVSNVWEISCCGDDAVNRTMVRVVLPLYAYLEMRVERVDYFTAFMHDIHPGRGWAEVNLLQVHNNAIVKYVLITYFMRDRCMSPSIPLVIVIFLSL
jgi:hypothetical protein